jgi:hypothetical protein
MAAKTKTEATANQPQNRETFKITITLKKREFKRLKSAADFLGLSTEEAVQSMVRSRLAKS